MKKLFEADFNNQKRFPGKDNNDEYFKPINVVKISLNKFPELLSDEEKPQERVINNTRGENF